MGFVEGLFSILGAAKVWPSFYQGAAHGLDLFPFEKEHDKNLDGSTVVPLMGNLKGKKLDCLRGYGVLYF